MINFNDSVFFKKINSLNDCIIQEKMQFLLNQNFKFDLYKEKRLEFIKNQPNNQFNLEYFNQFSPKIALFAGSFNPFHKGHYNILTKAEKIFDKVIIAYGKNPHKHETDWQIPKSILNRQIEHYDTLLSDLIISLGNNLTLIRGMRNTKDFKHEQNQYRYLQDLLPTIKVVTIFCDKEFEHVSSSAIRTLKKYDKHQTYLLD